MCMCMGMKWELGEMFLSSFPKIGKLSFSLMMGFMKIFSVHSTFLRFNLKLV